jgi:NAD(P)-dependent dehydrogenase (short-subunit alcohol dehydrogenase family)
MGDWKEWMEDQFDFDFGETRLRGETVLVAGGSGGLGSAATFLLARDGARVVVGYRSNRERAESLRRHVLDSVGVEIGLVQGDISVQVDRERLVETADSLGKGLYGMVCFTGDPARLSLEDMDIPRLASAMNENFSAPLLLARDAVVAMQRRQISGSVVLVSSMQVAAPFPNSFAYAGSKVALTHASKIMAKQWGGPGGIRVNSVAPGVNEAGMALKSVSSGKYQGFIDSSMIPRYGRPEDCGRVIRLLMQPDNYITGQLIVVDGGLTLHV